MTLKKKKTKDTACRCQPSCAVIPLPNNKIWLKMMIFVFDRVENIVGKGENAGYQHFLLFPQSF